MSLQTYVGIFNQRSGTGTQAVTGVGFQPKALLFYAISAVGSGVAGPMHSMIGFDDGTHHQGVATNAGDFENTYDGTETAASDSYSLITVRNSAAFQINALGYVTSLDADGFTVQWDQNSSDWSAGTPYWFLALGGTGISVKVGEIVPSTGAASQAYTGFGFAPVALFTSYHHFVNNSTNNNGGMPGTVGLGFATACGPHQGYTSGADDDLANPSNSSTFQTAASAFTVKDTSTTLVAGAITSWDSDGVTVNWTTGSGSTNTKYFGYLAIGGTCAANFGTFTQPIAIGAQRVTYTIADPKALVVMSANKASTASISAGLLFSMGAATPNLTQRSIWVGDADNKAPAAWAAQTDSNSVLIQTLVPTGATTSSATTVAALTDLSQGSFGLNWTTVDSTPREWLYIVLGADTESLPCGGAVPVVTTTYATRRLRRFQVAFDENKRIKLNRLELLCQQGVGLSTGQGSSPIVMIKISKDGGSTWGYELPMSLGAMGEYSFRTYLNRLPYGRNLVAEVTISDPVFAGFLACFVDLGEGTS